MSVRRKYIVSLCAALAGVTSATGVHSTAIASVGHAIVVRASSDPLQHLPDAALEKLGFRVDHLAQTIHYSDGGYGEVFNTSIGTVTLPVPANGFVPETASNAQLARYGFPPRPTDSAQLQSWQEEIANDRVTEPTIKVLERPREHATYYFTNWAGYGHNGPSAHYYRQIVGTWREPNIAGVCPYTASLAIWSGLAGGGNFPYNQSDIEQSGTYSYYDPTSGVGYNHEFWWEDFPTDPILLAGGFASTGDVVQNSITDLQYMGIQAFDWSVTDQTSGVFRNGTQPLRSAFLTQQVNWVVERASSGGTPMNLLPHSVINWTSTFASWGSGSGNAYNVGSSDFQMWSSDGKRELEYDSTALNSGGSFATSWNGYCY